MRRILSYIVSVALTVLAALQTVQASSCDTTAVHQRRSFKTHTVVYKGEKMAGLGVVYANLNSSNTEYLLMVNNLDASGALLRVAPQFACAYADNAAIGARFVYNNARVNLGKVDMNLLSKDLALSLSGQALGWTSYGGYVFHRNYIGLEKSGTVGFFCEFRLGYNYNRLDFGGGSYNAVHQAKLTFAPGFILYVLPFVSVEASIGLADLTYTGAASFNGGVKEGSRGKVGGGVSLKLLNCNFGIAYHF